MVNPQGLAIEIESVLRNVFNCERFGFGGIANSDFARRQPFTAMVCGLSFIYANAETGKKAEIEKFIEEHRFYSEMGIDYLLNFDTPGKDINGISIGDKTGEELLGDIIDRFKKLCL